MENQTISNFTKKMLSEKVFSCAICENLLSLPIMLVMDIGNVCHVCFERNNEKNAWDGLPNNKLNVLLRELQFPCKFELEGCKEEIVYAQLEDHQKKCIFRIVECLMAKDDCEWKGKLTDLPNHFTEEHLKHVVSSRNDNFSFEINFAKSTNIIKLLKNKNKSYILQIREDKEHEALLHFIYEISSKHAEMKSIIKYVGRNGQYKVKSKRLQFGTSCDENSGTKICIANLKEVAESSETITIIVKPEKSKIENLNEQLLKCLECPVCRDLMRPPIYQCHTGHSFCNACRPRLTECPSCRVALSDITDTRNFSLESLTSAIPYTCMYNQFGCDATFLGNEIDIHEGSCEFKMYQCPAPNCNFTGNYLSTKNHFKLNHEDDYVESTIYQEPFVQLNFNSIPTETTTYFFQHNNIYRLTFKRSKESCTWFIRILNNYDKKNKYSYTISIIDPKREERKTTKSNLCLNKDAKATDCNIILFAYTELISYKNSSNNDQIIYRCQIHGPRSE